MNFELSEPHKAALSTLSPEDQQLVTELWTSYSAAEVPEDKWRSLTSAQRKAYFSPFMRHTALSKRHAAELQAKEQKASEKARVKAEKEAAKLAKAAEREKLAAMTPEARKAYKKKLKEAQLMAGEPTLNL